MRLVKDARSAWRWFSVQAFALQGIAASAWLGVPDDLRSAVPAEWLAAGAIALTVFGIVGRLVDQEGAKDGTD
jgi:hypothetical protein